MLQSSSDYRFYDANILLDKSRGSRRESPAASPARAPLPRLPPARAFPKGQPIFFFIL